MAKFAFILATFAVLFLVSNATFHATIDIDEENPSGRRGGGDCQEQFQRQQRLNHCQMYMREECGGSRRGRDIDVNQGRQQLQQCCDQLEEMETRCRCQGLEQAVMQQQQQGGQQGRRMEREELYDCARNIPSMCRMEPSECQFRRRAEF